MTAFHVTTGFNKNDGFCDGNDTQVVQVPSYLYQPSTWDGSFRLRVGICQIRCQTRLKKNEYIPSTVRNTGHKAPTYRQN
jgi:hypothetical protein